MKVWKEQMYPDNERVYFTAYIQENSPEIDPKRKRPLMLVLPGGGYLTTSDREAEPVAEGYLHADYHVVVFRYTTMDRGNSVFPNPLIDVARLMEIIHEHAEEWMVDRTRIFVSGFSAGGHLAASLGVHWDKEWLAEASGVANELLRPAGVVLGYPVTDLPYIEERALERPSFHVVDPDHGMSRYQFIQMMYEAMAGKDAPKEKLAQISPVYSVSKSTAPMFIWATATDDMIFVGNSIRLASQLEKHEIPFELHIFPTGPHGMSTATAASSGSDESLRDPKVATWFEMALSFLQSLPSLA